MPTTSERLDPNSPHYDKDFAELRRQAYKGHADHENDMKNDPVYKAAFENMQQNNSRKQK